MIPGWLFVGAGGWGGVGIELWARIDFLGEAIDWRCWLDGNVIAVLPLASKRQGMDSPSVAGGRQPRSSCWCETLEDAAKTDGVICYLANL